jgi:hypothetical protein
VVFVLPPVHATLLALILTAAAPEEQVQEQVQQQAEVYEVPIVSRAPGITAFWIGGGVLGVAAEVSATGLCFVCAVAPNTDPRFQAFALSTIGTVSVLAGMAWMVWRQPPDEPTSKTPGFAAAIMGATQIVAGLVGFFAPLVGSSAGALHDGQPMAFTVGSGVVTLAAGVAWLVWARGH